MRARTRIIIVFTLIIIAVFSIRVKTHGEVLDPTHTPTPMPPSDFENYFDQYSNQYGVDKELLKKIAYCESGGNPGAHSGPYGGMFQFSESTWIATRSDMGADTNVNLRFGAKESIETAAFKISKGGEKAWLNCIQ